MCPPLVRVREQVLLGLVHDTQSAQSVSHSDDVKFEWKLLLLISDDAAEPAYCGLLLLLACCIDGRLDACQNWWLQSAKGQARIVVSSRSLLSLSLPLFKSMQQIV